MTAGCQPANGCQVGAGLGGLHPGRRRPPLRPVDHGQEVDDAAAVDRVVQQVRARPHPELQRAGIGQAAAAVRPGPGRGTPTCPSRRARRRRSPSASRGDPSARHVRQCTPSAPTTRRPRRRSPTSSAPACPSRVSVRVSTRQPRCRCSGPSAPASRRCRAIRCRPTNGAPNRLAVPAAVPAGRDRRPSRPSRWMSRVGSVDTRARSLAQAQVLEHPRRVGGQADRRADLAQFGGLLEHLGGDAALAQQERQREPADTSPDDHYRRIAVRHHASSLVVSWPGPVSSA